MHVRNFRGSGYTTCHRNLCWYSCVRIYGIAPIALCVYVVTTLRGVMRAISRRMQINQQQIRGLSLHPALQVATGTS